MIDVAPPSNRFTPKRCADVFRNQKLVDDGVVSTLARSAVPPSCRERTCHRPRSFVIAASVDEAARIAAAAAIAGSPDACVTCACSPEVAVGSRRGSRAHLSSFILGTGKQPCSLHRTRLSNTRSILFGFGCRFTAPSQDHQRELTLAAILRPFTTSAASEVRYASSYNQPMNTCRADSVTCMLGASPMYCSACSTTASHRVFDFRWIAASVDGVYIAGDVPH